MCVYFIPRGLKLQDWYIYARPWCCNKNGCATATCQCDNETSSYFGDFASDIVQMVCRAPFGSAILVCDEYKIRLYEAAKYRMEYRFDRTGNRSVEPVEHYSDCMIY